MVKTYKTQHVGNDCFIPRGENPVHVPDAGQTIILMAIVMIPLMLFAKAKKMRKPTI